MRKRWKKYPELNIFLYWERPLHNKKFTRDIDKIYMITFFINQMSWLLMYKYIIYPLLYVKFYTLLSKNNMINVHGIIC